MLGYVTAATIALFGAVEHCSATCLVISKGAFRWLWRGAVSLVLLSSFVDSHHRISEEAPCNRRLIGPWAISHEVSVDPVDDACIDVSNKTALEPLGFWHRHRPKSLSHAPSTLRISDDHGHSRFDMQEDRI